LRRVFTDAKANPHRQKTLLLKKTAAPPHLDPPGSIDSAPRPREETIHFPRRFLVIFESVHIRRDGFHVESGAVPFAPFWKP